MSYDRPTSKDVERIFGQYEELVKEYGLIRPGYNLTLDIGSKTYGRAYRVHEVADRSLWGKKGDSNDYRGEYGSGHYEPTIGQNYLGMTAAEACESLIVRKQMVYDMARAWGIEKTNPILDCGHFPTPMASGSLGTGKAIGSNGASMCYACADDATRRDCRPGHVVTMADELSSAGMSALDQLAREYGHDDNYESDEMGACASWYKLSDGMRVAYTLASGSNEIVAPYAYVRSDDHGFWNVIFTDSKSQARDWLAMWADNNVPPSDDDLADDGETVLVENAREWEGWEDFLGGYITCALWSSTHDNDGENLDSHGFDKDDLSVDALKSIEDDCSAFMFYNYRKLQRVGTMAQHGHDFWLTRNRHGAGYWDRGYGDIGEDLTDKAHTYGESDLYVGDDGKVEVQ